MMNGLTAPEFGSTTTMRELLFCPPPWVAWFESVANSRPPWKPCSKAMSTAGPAGWNPPPLLVGFPSGPPIFLPFWSKTTISGVNGFAASKTPPGHEPCSLQSLGKPCPDSSTYTLNRFVLPRNAMPVGIFKPLAKTEIVKPGGTLMFCPLPGSKKAVSDLQSGFATTLAAVATLGRASSGATASAVVKASRRFPCMTSSLPHLLLGLSSAFVNCCGL